MIPNVSTNEPVLSLKNVGIAFQRRTSFLKKEQFWALKNISLNLYHGETLGIIGRNGAGKSTLLKVLADVLTPDKGEIVRSVSHTSLLSLQVGFVPHLTGAENAILSGMLLGVSKSIIEQRMNSIIKFSELGEFIHQPVNTYSSGMRARLGFSVAFQADPDILLVDEVLGVGDQEFREKSAAAMREKIKSNKTIVLVSHNPAILSSLCDRIVWIEHGVTKMIGDVADILQFYQTSNRNIAIPTK